MNKITRPKKGLLRLRTGFRDSIIALERTCQIEGVYMRRFETFRSGERQDYLFAKNRSDAEAGESPHNYGLAVDFTLNTDLVRVRSREWKGKMYPDAWDIETPEAAETWRRFGLIVRRLGLEWGGNWKRNDYPHVQAAQWRNHLIG